MHPTILEDHIDEYFDTWAEIWTDTIINLIFYRQIFKIDIRILIFYDTCTSTEWSVILKNDICLSMNIILKD